MICEFVSIQFVPFLPHKLQASSKPLQPASEPSGYLHLVRFKPAYSISPHNYPMPLSSLNVHLNEKLDSS